MIEFVGKAIEVAEKAAEKAVEIREDSKAQDISAISKFEYASTRFKEGLSDEALKARVEAAAHSACKFFEIPDAELIEGDAIGVYRECDIFLDKDVFEYSLDQFKDMKCVSFEDMTKVWAHECGHRILRMDFPSSWAQELGADFFSGVRSEMLGLPTSNFEKVLGSTTGSASHPVGNLRVQAIQFGREVVRGFQEKGITPTIENCKEAFAKSPFSEITYENNQNPKFASITNTFISAKDVSKEGLPKNTKIELKKETNWSSNIIDNIRSTDEAEIYKSADLECKNINGKDCLVRKDIDYNLKDEFGRTNQERMQMGLAPLDKNHSTIDLHHVGQKSDSPLAELTKKEHHSCNNDLILHDKTQKSQIDRSEFRLEKENHWKSRAEELNN